MDWVTDIPTVSPSKYQVRHSSNTTEVIESEKCCLGTPQSPNQSSNAMDISLAVVDDNFTNPAGVCVWMCINRHTYVLPSRG